MLAKKESNRRLLKLAKHLESVPPKRFNYHLFTRGAPSEFNCGTQGCALGHAVEVPEFQKLGLRIERTFGDRFSGIVYRTVNDPFHAAAAFFGVYLDEATGLFAPECGDPVQDPMFVSQKIRDFVMMR